MVKQVPLFVTITIIFNAPLFGCMPHNYQDLITLFSNTFDEQFNTRLVKGGDEPIYLPANDNCAYHQIIFAHGYFSSALHEISHWCVAGEARRKLEDFGYWYVPDGRNEIQQKSFENVEIVPQAIEWAFNAAANKKFSVSSDNLNGFEADTDGFTKKVHAQVIVFLENGFPKRAQQFIDALAKFYQTNLPLNANMFTLPESCFEEV